MKNPELNIVDVVIVGGGPTGMAAALECAAQNFSVKIVAPSESHIATDARTTALMVPSLDMLRRFGIWDDIVDAAAPLRTLRIIDDTGRLVRAPTISFEASEIDQDAFGYNIPNRVLTGALNNAFEGNNLIDRVDALVSAVSYEDQFATVILSDGAEICTKLVVGADGTDSIVRQSAGIDMRKWTYEQTACVLAFDHERPHGDISTEFHTRFGPFTQVPLPGNRSSLVWVKQPDEANAFLELNDSSLCLAVEKQMQSMLGRISNPTKPQAWPLSGAVAHRFASHRMILIGQAAHAFPPIGAQGLNLGMRDIADLSAVLKSAKGDAGKVSVTQTYDRKRRADVYLRTGAVDALNRSLLTGFAPLQIGRAAGLGLLKTVGPLRNMLMREGIMPGSTITNLFKRTPKGDAA